MEYHQLKAQWEPLLSNSITKTPAVSRLVPFQLMGLVWLAKHKHAHFRSALMLYYMTLTWRTTIRLNIHERLQRNKPHLKILMWLHECLSCHFPISWVHWDACLPLVLSGHRVQRHEEAKLDNVYKQWGELERKILPLSWVFYFKCKTPACFCKMQPVSISFSTSSFRAFLWKKWLFQACWEKITPENIFVTIS